MGRSVFGEKQGGTEVIEVVMTAMVVPKMVREQIASGNRLKEDQDLTPMEKAKMAIMCCRLFSVLLSDLAATHDRFLNKGVEASELQFFLQDGAGALGEVLDWLDSLKIALSNEIKAVLPDEDFNVMLREMQAAYQAVDQQLASFDSALRRLKSAQPKRPLSDSEDQRWLFLVSI